MGRSSCRIIVLLCSFALLCAPEASAQPELWSTAFTFPTSGLLRSNRVVVTDVTTGATVEEFVAPENVCVGRGEMAADHRSYFVPVQFSGAAAIVRFDTATRAIAEIVPIAVPPLGTLTDCGTLAVSPSGRWWHVWWRNTTMTTHVVVRRNVDAVSASSSNPNTADGQSLAVTFDPAGRRRFELADFEHAPSLRAYDDGSESPLWEVEPAPAITPSAARFVAGAQGVYVAVEGDLVRYDAASGAELARVQLSAFANVAALAVYKGRIFISGAEAGTFAAALATFDELTLAPGPANTTTGLARGGDLHFDSHAHIGYWHRQQAISAGGAIHFLQSFDPDTLTLGPLLETAAPIAFAGLADVGVPGHVTLTEAASAAGQVTIAWQPDAAGAPATRVEIHGAARGEPLVPIAVVDPATRRWTSPALPSGSYTIELIARNRIGAGPAARLEISVADPAVPAPPIDLVTQSAGDAVSVSWQPAPGGAAPMAYIVEAATFGSSSFIAVAQPVLPRFATTGAPAGTWHLRVRALTAGGSSVPSDVVMVTTTICTAPPAPPSAVAAMVTNRLVTMVWRPPAAGDSLEYVVEAASSATLPDFARLPITSGTASFETTAPPGVYVVRVRARNSCGESAPSNEIVVRVP